jgi:hypothetical protein
MNKEALIQRLREEATHELNHETIALILEAAGALAQPEQEPDVVMHCESNTWTINNPPAKGSGDVNLYYIPAQSAPVQEPVAGHIGWLVRNSQGRLDLLTELQIDSSLEKYERLHKLYTTPPAAQRTWVGLTDEEFHEACWESHVDPVTGECSTGDREYAVRWTEAKLKDKNT